MALVPMTASEINEIKSRIKIEFEKRCGYGPVNQYTDSFYDFDTVPEVNKRILSEHGEKTLDLLLEVGEISNTYKTKKNRIIPPGFNNEQLTNFLTELENDVDGSSCRGGCTGLCLGGCFGKCSGCADECSGGCGSGCSTGCGGDCYSSCT